MRNQPLFIMKFKTKTYLADFYGYEFKANEPTDVKEATIIKKCRNNPLFSEVRKVNDTKRTV